MTTIGSIPPSKSEATASRLMRSPSFSSRWISSQPRRDVHAGAQASVRARDLLAGADEHVGELERLLHRRLDPVEDELVGGLLGVVDDVVQRRGEPVAVGGAHQRPPPRGARRPAVEPVDDVVGDPVGLLLALQERPRDLGVGGRIDEDPPQQRSGALHRLTRLVEEVVQRSVRATSQGRHRPQP
jgi:hypothetical protein